jgi:uncharacterized protein YyaL (SSP411 family)
LAPSGRREEGAFFTWTPAELAESLGAEDARLARAWFGVSDVGDVDGRSVLRSERSAKDVAREFGLSTAALAERLDSTRARLRASRAKRPPPARDEKVIVAWNALAISAFARAAITLGEARYADAAVRAAAALLQPRAHPAKLPHLFVAGQPKGRAFADDTVLLAAALLDVFELTADASWLERAIALMETLEDEFSDQARGGYFLSAGGHEQLLLRDKPDYDGPTPSVNSAAAMTWLRLAAFSDEARYRSRAETTLRAFSRTLTSRPLALDQMLLALDFATDAVKEIVIVVPEGRGALVAAARPLLDVLSRRFVPNSALLVVGEQDVAGELGRKVPWLREKRLRSGRATAYVCERGACQLPTNEPSIFAAQLVQATPYR